MKALREFVARHNCGQLYAFHPALSLGNKLDQPSHSGTMSRVVSGASIPPL